jgi:hypothetical protein
MRILNDEIIDSVANLCWHYQGIQIKNKVQVPCICNVLQEMVKITRLEVAKEIDRLCTDECQVYPNIYYHNAHNAAADIARGVKQ